ncbi:MAG TPA: nucleotidyltransferase family protein [Candidatus Polarisedimenticolia bacterium]|nr:nucleotidyltransferase family protein [Candidatus Polarisedimenticolia bacterium]
MPASSQTSKRFLLQRALLNLLRGEIPSDDFPEAEVDACLKRYECGGYLQRLWSGAGRTADLPSGWAAGMARAHRKTVVDNLGALAQFRTLAPHLLEERVEFILLKGASYLVDLYDDPGARMLTDIDLLIRRRDAARLSRRLMAAGYRGGVGDQFPEDRRFEIWRPGEGKCHFEFHWWLIPPFRARFDQEAIWERSRPVELEGVSGRRLAVEDAILYHAAHQADHYFGPSIKWLLDLREMLRHWPIDLDALAGLGAASRARITLHLALRHLEKVFPDDLHAGVLDRLSPGPLRRRLLEGYMAADPLELVDRARSRLSFYALRFLMIDRPTDAVGLTLRVALRPITGAIGRILSGSAPPWEWRDASD